MEDNLNDNTHSIPIIEQNSTIEPDKPDIASQIIPFFNKGEASLLRTIKQSNEVENLLLKGEYRKSKDKDNDYGFFEKISHLSGKKIFYPILKTSINSIFVPPNYNYLTEGSIYTFEVKIAHYKERQKQQNPFLLQTKMESIEESIQLSEIQSKILEENKLLSDVKEKATGIIKQYDKTIDEKVNLLTNINDQISEIKIQLSEITNKKSEMEATINFLRQKIDICKNLEFLSEQDAAKYLDILKITPFEQGDKYLDFEKDLSANFPKLVTHIQNYLYHKKNLIYTEFQIKNFMSLLMTNDLIVLSGLSGSGKTQIVKSFAEVLGGVAKIIPVKPNWTSSDDLLGYYNPIQSSFLPTPFTEAIAEASQNPHQIYLICLDEMNLARVEYYFADFLSKMEERSEQPEIELYAKHEEELFISEFKTLLTLIESATGEKIVSSWQEFLETDSFRNRFFELLGNTEKETLLQIHSKMKRRLLDILKFPATIKIPNNVRFIGAINVDETTHYFSPKILDRVHIVKFENPLLIEDKVISEINGFQFFDIDEKDLKPVYVSPFLLPNRSEYPHLGNDIHVVEVFKEINKRFLLELNIDFGVRSIRQALNFYKIYSPLIYHEEAFCNTINVIIIQKILPRFIFDGNENTRSGKSKIEILREFHQYILTKFDTYWEDEDGIPTRNLFPKVRCSEYIILMINNAEKNNNQVNFYA